MTSTLFRQAQHIVKIQTTGNGFYEINQVLNDWISSEQLKDGLLTLFIRHTSASLTIQENADPDVVHDLKQSLDQLAPRSAHYRHSSEGPDDMPSHIKGMLTDTQLSIPVQSGKMVLGTWQGVFVIEHRDRPNTRQVALHFLGS